MSNAFLLDTPSSTALIEGTNEVVSDDIDALLAPLRSAVIDLFEKHDAFIDTLRHRRKQREGLDELPPAHEICTIQIRTKEGIFQSASSILDRLNALIDGNRKDLQKLVDELLLVLRNYELNSIQIPHQHDPFYSDSAWDAPGT